MVGLRNFTCEDIPVLKNNGYAEKSYEELCDIIERWQTDKMYGNAYFEMFAIDCDDELIGSASLYQKSGSIVSCGIEIYPEYRQTGYATAAYMQLLETARHKQYGIAIAQVSVVNVASVKLHRKLGFETDGYEYVNKKGEKIYIFLKALR